MKTFDFGFWFAEAVLAFFVYLGYEFGGNLGLLFATAIAVGLTFELIDYYTK
jgi:hypothetical protein